MIADCYHAIMEWAGPCFLRSMRTTVLRPLPRTRAHQDAKSSGGTKTNGLSGRAIGGLYTRLTTTGRLVSITRVARRREVYGA